MRAAMLLTTTIRPFPLCNHTELNSARLKHMSRILSSTCFITAPDQSRQDHTLRQRVVQGAYKWAHQPRLAQLTDYDVRSSLAPSRVRCTLNSTSRGNNRALQCRPITRGPGTALWLLTEWIGSNCVLHGRLERQERTAPAAWQGALPE